MQPEDTYVKIILSPKQAGRMYPTVFSYLKIITPPPIQFEELLPLNWHG